MPPGPTPKAVAERRNHHTPRGGEWQSADGVGWQHSDMPDPPEGLMPASEQAWRTWMGAWFAAHWSPEDLPGLRLLIRLYDQVERGEFVRSGELRLGMDTYGITPKGQQDRRWAKPVDGTAPAKVRQIKPRKLRSM